MGPFPDRPGYETAVELDRSDPLLAYRDRFVISEPDLIYLDGNSLGRMPKAAASDLQKAAEHEWGERLIRSWNEGWWMLQLELGDLLTPLLGADAGELIISDSTSVNLYKLASAAVRSMPGRSKIVTDDLNFPTDVHVLSGIAKHEGMELEIVETNSLEPDHDALFAAIDSDTALVSLTLTTFKSGYTYDIREITARAHQHGALVLWDLSHSAGVMPIDLRGAGVDLAVGCTYKYLNGGPGSPAFIYVRTELQADLENPITAWWAHAEPFEFDLEFLPVEGIRKFHTGTMPTLSLIGCRAGIELALEAGIEPIRAKSLKLTDLFISLADEVLNPLGFSVATPRDPASRGSHVSLSHQHAWPITKALIDRGQVIPDFRTPDLVRFGFSPLYTSFTEVHTAVGRLADLVQSEAHLEYADAKATVT